jgi:hypothetical protein
VNSLRKLGLATSFKRGGPGFAGGPGMFNPLRYAWEAGFRRKPTYTEFVGPFEEGVAELRRALPTCALVCFNEAHYRMAFAIPMH